MKNIHVFMFLKLTSKDHRGKRNRNSYKDAETLIKRKINWCSIEAKLKDIVNDKTESTSSVHE